MTPSGNDDYFIQACTHYETYYVLETLGNKTVKS